MFDAIITGVTSVMMVVASVLVMRFLAVGLGPHHFGAYILSRRIIALLIPVVALSVGTGLPRYLGLHRDSHQRQQGFILASSLIVGTLTLITAIVLLGLDESFAVLLFDDPRVLDGKYALLFIARSACHDYLEPSPDLIHPASPPPP